MADSLTSNLGVCPDCNGPFNGEFAHQPDHCISSLRAELKRLDADAACEKAEKESLKLEVERLRAERDNAREAPRISEGYVRELSDFRVQAERLRAALRRISDDNGSLCADWDHVIAVARDALGSERTAVETTAGTGGEPGLATQVTVKESRQADRCLTTGVPRQIDTSACDQIANGASAEYTDFPGGAPHCPSCSCAVEEDDDETSAGLCKDRGCWFYGKPIPDDCDCKPTDETAEMARIGRAFMERLPKDYCWSDSPAEFVTELENRIHDLQQQLKERPAEKASEPPKCTCEFDSGGEGPAAWASFTTDTNCPVHGIVPRVGL
jgi:hypothetical protein